MRRTVLSLQTMIGFAAIVRMTACLQSSNSPQPDASTPPGLDGSQEIPDVSSGSSDVTVAQDAGPDATVARDASSSGDAALDAPADAIVYTYRSLQAFA